MTGLIAPRGALQRHAQDFLPIPGKALVSVVMIYDGQLPEALDQGGLTASDLPMTIAIDPLRADASRAAAAYRAAGFEVAILAAALPPRATPSDLEVALQAWRAAVPEAVAVVEPPEPVIQANRPLSQQLTAILAREGLALVTQDRGLNPAAQLAESAGLPQARVWRVLDAGSESPADIARALDRAAFEAGRDRQVAVMLYTRPGSVAALADWADTSGAGAQPAPVSALMRPDGG
ncbi:hypothetical protein CCR83_00770 [Rhodobacter veldkampii DSM 11550]|nr:hypothetical protein [Phaeovulum veldkampii DSM 11550]